MGSLHVCLYVSVCVSVHRPDWAYVQRDVRECRHVPWPPPLRQHQCVHRLPPHHCGSHTGCRHIHLDDEQQRHPHPEVDALGVRADGGPGIQKPPARVSDPLVWEALAVDQPVRDLGLKHRHDPDVEGWEDECQERHVEGAGEAHIHTHTLSLSHTHYLSLTHTLYFSPSHTHAFFLFISHAQNTLYLSLSLPLSDVQWLFVSGGM